jgi:ABC-type phosphonate transport system ATPase subunit
VKLTWLSLYYRSGNYYVADLSVTNSSTGGTMRYTLAADSMREVYRLADSNRRRFERVQQDLITRFTKAGLS